MPLSVVAKIYAAPEEFRKGVLGLLACGDVFLLKSDGTEIPNWQWRDIFSAGRAIEQLEHLRLTISPQGAKRIS